VAPAAAASRMVRMPQRWCAAAAVIII
jgi:hypothetical protein